MIRKSLLLSVSLLITAILYAGPVSREQALQVASKFLADKNAAKGAPHRAPATVELKPEVALGAVDDSGQPYLYAITSDTQEGFVIVSGDDRTEQVLGYSLTGRYDANNLPSNMRAWLQGYIDEMKHLKDTPAKSVSQAPNRAVKSSIAPLLISEWDQDEPYNNNCPMFCNTGNRCVTGCVTTAMAQIMYFHRYPATTQAVIPAYNCKTNWVGYGQIAVSAIAISDLNWNSMTPTYNNNSSSEEKAAVAFLMQCCGASVQMNYRDQTNGGSSASNSTAVDALKTMGAGTGRRGRRRGTRRNRITACTVECRPLPMKKE